jgi:hypothetical protein
LIDPFAATCPRDDNRRLVSVGNRTTVDESMVYSLDVNRIAVPVS